MASRNRAILAIEIGTTVRKRLRTRAGPPPQRAEGPALSSPGGP